MATKFMSVVSARGKNAAEKPFSAIWPPCRRGRAHAPHMQLDRRHHRFPHFLRSYRLFDRTCSLTA